MIEFLTNNRDVLVTILGILATTVIAISYFARKRSVFFALQIAGNVFIMLSYLVSMSFLACISYVISTSRMITFMVFEKLKKDVPWFVIAIIVSLNIISSILLWRSPLDLIILIGMVSYTVSCKIKDGLIMRIAFIVPLSLYWIYAIVDSNLGSFIPSIFEFGASLVSLVVEIVLRKGLKLKQSKKIESKDAVSQNGDSVLIKTVTKDVKKAD